MGIFRNVPAGVAPAGRTWLGPRDEDRVLAAGAGWAGKSGYGAKRTPSASEDGGRFPDADPDAVSGKAKERGRSQLGTLGSGNHFIEIGCVDEVFDPDAAKAMGLFEGQVTVTVHTGSRGLGYQVCDGFIVDMKKAARHYGIELPDPQLCCAPVNSPEG